MTPAKEKAKQLVDKYYKSMFDIKLSDTHIMQTAKQCALIAVDEILSEYWSHNTKRRDWWQEVKNEIEKR
jgi:hypothetical protein